MPTNLLMILDGWGHSEKREFNAAAQAHTPCLDKLFAQYPNTLIDASGTAVGLPVGQMGNSEVGHINLGAGRIVDQQFVAINKAIDNGSFFSNQRLIELFNNKQNNNIHVICMLSDGGIHSHQNHLYALCKLAEQQQANNLRIHLILDGRDTSPKSAINYIEQLETQLSGFKVGKIASVVGRFYAMDRDNRWDRVERAYNLFTQSSGEYYYSDAQAAVKAAYARGETDEFIAASVISEPGKIAENDSIVLLNFRPDRMIQLTHALYDQEFTHFKRSGSGFEKILTMTEYQASLAHLALYKSAPVTNSLGEHIASLGLKQLRIAETEKYAHVTFFFNGGREDVFVNEERHLVPSPKVSTYDLQPQMSAQAITDHLVKVINKNEYDLIICNYANCDMVGHTGNMQAAITAMQTVDTSIARVLTALDTNSGQCLITADHGNLENMYDNDIAQPHTAHTTNLVPLVYYGAQNIHFRSKGKLCDVAPTLLKLMNLPQPVQMSGRALCELYNNPKL